MDRFFFQGGLESLNPGKQLLISTSQLFSSLGVFLVLPQWSIPILTGLEFSVWFSLRHIALKRKEKKRKVLSKNFYLWLQLEIALKMKASIQ